MTSRVGARRWKPRDLRRLSLLGWGVGAIVLILDQWIKIWVKTHMQLGEEFVLIDSWARIHFVENNGIAFGMELAGKVGKLLLSLLRIGMVGFMFYLGKRMFRSREFPVGVLVGLSLIIAGALGNIIDGTFYGVLFSSSQDMVQVNGQWVTPVAQLLPEAGGYAPLFFGKVVDMFYFPLFSIVWPSWMPWIGGQSFSFFQPVFNLADAAITCGVFYLLLFKGKYLLSLDRKS